MADSGQRKYNSPPSNPSDVGVQLTDHYFQKKALIEAVKEQYFGQLADVTSMPKNMGKKIVKYHYLPLLDDRNINDQGIDAAGVTIDSSKWYVTLASLTKDFAVEADATAAAAAVNALEVGIAVKSGTATPWTVTVSKLDLAPGTQLLCDAVKAIYTDAVVRQGSGNMYGSSKDVGFISGKMPSLSETGGRVNRVGFKRITIEGTFENFGFFDEYTQDSLDFDSDDQLREHVNREMLRGANEFTEDALQIDLLTSAGTVRYPGAATSNATLNNTTVVTYSDLMHLSIDLDNNRTPKKTTMITGTRLVDTRTIGGARVAYIGSELIPTLTRMKDLHNNPAFIPLEKYAAGGTTLNGEIGMIDGFRFVVVPEMMNWEGAGAAVGGATGFYTNGSNFNVYPILVVGDESFTTIGFQTDGKSVKFKIYHKAPGEGTVDRNDPYGKTGLMSIQWWYGFMALRPERIALLKTVAQM